MEQGAGVKKSKKGKLPSPKELVAHYEKEGMASEEASLKVIQDLQSALFRVISANRNTRNSPDMNAIHSRLLNLEMKVDSKPGYPQSLAIGVASVGIWNGALQLWNTVRQATSSNHSS